MGVTDPVHDHRWQSVMYFEQPQYKLLDYRPVETELT